MVSKTSCAHSTLRQHQRFHLQLHHVYLNVLFILLLLSAVSNIASAQPYHFMKPPAVSVVFSIPSKTPALWTSATDFNTKFNLIRADRSRLRGIPGLQPEFRTVLVAQTFEYAFRSPSITGPSTLRLGLIDPAEKCSKGTRQFKFVLNGVETQEIDVAASVGCLKPYYLDIPFSLPPSGDVSLSFTQTSILKPAICNLRLFSGDPPPTPFPNAQAVDIKLDLGTSTMVPGTTPITATDVRTKKLGNIPKQAFSSGVQGANFAISFNVPTGTYDVTLGFAELNPKQCVKGERVFNTLINGKVRLSSFDIFARAKGRCKRSYIERFGEITVDNLEARPIVVSFEGVSGLALINYIGIEASQKQCIPVTDDAEVTDDHLAHSVPGSYKPVVDTIGRGFVNVRIDGSDSHTHFYANGIQGRIKSYKWTEVDTGKVISTKATFSRNFELGTTRLRLDVVDTICSQDDDITVITVTGSRQKGQYCYYYQGISSLPASIADVDALKPSFSKEISRLRNNMEPPFSDPMYLIRCQFFVEFDAALGFTSSPSKARLSIKTGGSGEARIFSGDELILDTGTSSESAEFKASLGTARDFDVLFLRTNPSVPIKMNFKVNGRTPRLVSHDKATIIPIASSLSPSSGPATGGTSVRIQGYGFYPPVRVLFAGIPGTVRSVSGSTNIFVDSPPATTPGTVSVVVESASGRRSQTLDYEYGGECDPPQFTRTEWKMTSGGQVNLKQPTSVALWSDGRLYVGCRDGRVRVATYDHEANTVSNICHSEILYDNRYYQPSGEFSPRTILGITFDPRDRLGRPYVTTSTLFWLNQKKIDPANKRGWSNGNVERLKPISGTSDPLQCLAREKIVVSGLPIGAADHSVNELIFDQNGDLLITVAGLTNAGLPGPLWGGIWESYYSAAVIRAKLSLKDFNGQIEYINPEDATTAKPTEKSEQFVQLYATGFRNLFTLIMTRGEKLYGIDMGTDCKWGNVSTSCSQYNPATEPFRNRNEPFPGTVVVGPEGVCKYSGERSDQLYEVRDGLWYGHSNLQRAAARGTSYECQWVDPRTGRLPGNLGSAPSVYKHRDMMLTSPMTGLREYGANHFCGKMRFNLIIARYKETKSLRLEPNGNGGYDPTQIQITDKGAIRVEENEHGHLIYPRLIREGVTVLLPNIREKRGVFVAGVAPFRHGRKGRTLIRIGGWGFKKMAKVMIGGKRCKNRKITSTTIVCKVPMWSKGPNLVDVKVSIGGVESMIPNAVLYMNV